MYFRYFVINSLGKGLDPLFKQTWILFTLGCIVPTLAEIRFLNFRQMYICYFVIISPWKRAGSFIWTILSLHHAYIRMFLSSLIEISPVVLKKNFKFWTNLNLLHPRMHIAKFGLSWSSGSGEDENVKCLPQWTNSYQKSSFEPTTKVS